MSRRTGVIKAGTTTNVQHWKLCKEPLDLFNPQQSFMKPVLMIIVNNVYAGFVRTRNPRKGH
jgi:hypothetical protein